MWEKNQVIVVNKILSVACLFIFYYVSIYVINIATFNCNMKKFQTFVEQNDGKYPSDTLLKYNYLSSGFLDNKQLIKISTS